MSELLEQGVTNCVAVEPNPEKLSNENGHNLLKEVGKPSLKDSGLDDGDEGELGGLSKILPSMINTRIKEAAESSFNTKDIYVHVMSFIDMTE